METVYVETSIISYLRQKPSTQVVLAARQLLNEILADHTKQPIERIARDTQRDHYLNAVDAKAYGLVDEILERPPKEKKK